MRKIFKKVVTVVASMAMVAGMIATAPAMDAQAATNRSVWIVGTMNGWDPSSAPEMSTADGRTYVWEKDVKEAGTDEFKILVNQASWGNDHGYYGDYADNYQNVEDAWGNIKVSYAREGHAKFEITLNENNDIVAAKVTGTAVGQFVAPEEYYLVGEAALTGAEWDTTKNQMTAEGNGKYSITFTGVAAGTYEFKVCKAQNWSYGQWPEGQNNFKVTVPSAMDVKLTFDVNDGTISHNIPNAVIETKDNGLGGETATTAPTQSQTPATQGGNDTQASAGVEVTDGNQPLATADNTMVWTFAICAVVAMSAFVIANAKKEEN